MTRETIIAAASVRAGAVPQRREVMLYDLYRVLAWRAWANGQRDLMDQYLRIAQEVL